MNIGNIFDTVIEDVEYIMYHSMMWNKLDVNVLLLKWGMWPFMRDS